MNIITIGASPYQLTSNGKIHSEVIKHFYSQGHGVVSAVWGHDVNYFPPIENNGKKEFFYDCKINCKSHSIPIVPFAKGPKDAIAVYEIVNTLKPDIVVTIGDFNDFLFMKAVKMYYSGRIKWLSILNNFSFPINEQNHELVADMDGILCINKFTLPLIQEIFVKDNFSQSYFGSALECNTVKNTNKFRVMTMAKNIQSDNLPAIMKAVSFVRDQIPEIELYCHSNIYDNGDYDLNLIKGRFDPKDEFIRFPDKYVSLFDGLSDNELAEELGQSHVFISASLTSSSGIGCLDAISCGCIPALSNVGIYPEIVDSLVGTMWKKEDLLIKGVELMAPGETYLYVTGYEEIANCILRIYKKLKNQKGEPINLPLYDIANKFSRDKFLACLSDMAGRTNEEKEVICLESV